MSKAGDSSHHLHGEGEVLVRAERAELQEARHGRKHAEQNLQLLSNRIALLRQEAKYAEKQIAEANKKKAIIEERRAERAEWQRCHQEQVRQREAEAEAIRQQTRSRRKRVELHREKSDTSRLSRKHLSAQQTRSLHGAKEDEREQTKRQLRNQNIQRCREAKLSREIARQKIAREQLEKQERIRNVLHKEVNRENHLRKNYDAQALSFEQEEAMLLERMQGLQLEMKETFSRLDEVVAEGKTGQLPSARNQTKSSIPSARGLPRVAPNATTIEQKRTILSSNNNNPRSSATLNQSASSPRKQASIAMSEAMENDSKTLRTLQAAERSLPKAIPPITLTPQAPPTPGRGSVLCQPSPRTKKNSILATPKTGFGAGSAPKDANVNFTEEAEDKSDKNVVFGMGGRPKK